MAKKFKERNELEYLRAKNRKLQAELREVKRNLSRYEKRSHLFEELSTQENNQEIHEEQDLLRCPQCGKGILTSVIITSRTIISCPLCTYRQVKKE